MKFSILTAALLMAGYATAIPMINPTSFSDGTVAPLYAPIETEAVRGSYIVVLKKDLSPEQVENHAEWISSMSAANSFNSGDYLDNQGINHVYEMPNFKGYSGRFDTKTLEAIRQSDEVAYVEEDSVVYASELQRGAPWGLARISTRDRLSLRNFNKYHYDAKAAGEGIKVYVIDTGINVKHVDFEGRAVWGKTIPLNDADIDGNGHGSHCAGTIAGKKYGVAKKAIPVAVKVLSSNGSGSMSDVVKGVDWATNEFLKDKAASIKAGKPFKGSAANMSLGGGKSPSLDATVNGAVEAGLVFAVAAGNDNKDACDYSPARAELAITVGASTIFDERAYFSNYGECVDVFAPGLNIESVWNTNDHATNTISGTSMASPHVAGLAAYLLSSSPEGTTPKEIKQQIIELSTRNVFKGLPNKTPNLLIFNGYESS
ncbi:serine protease [Cokeromyces recurvatus]|uniref:serine protease n=1 Tax=Cokeromyces recurvatus TaxID=90255 RepID=UPI00221E703F|nr:serine protease [Cokeromyces recurvatus]KAI7904070.1 serine protease [Cokeromyces recurvatus]